MPRTYTADELPEVIRLIPGYDPYRDAGKQYHFDAKLAASVLAFFPAQLKHVEGKIADTPFYLEPWQAAIVANLFGWRDKDGLRRYRHCMLYVPRKNGKSILGAGIATTIFCCEREPGMQIVSAASEQKQARLIWKMARTMIEKNPELSDRVKFYQASMVLRSDPMSNWQYWSAEAGSKHGGNVHLGLCDELHQMDRELVDVITSGMGARTQPLTLYFTTADYLRESVCNDMYKLACDVRDGTNRVANFLPIIYEISAEDLKKDPDCWKKEEYWYKANPNLGISKRVAFMEEEVAKATSIPAYEGTVKRLQGNIRTDVETRLISADKWALNDGELSIADYENEIPAGVGLDIGATSDLCSLCIIYDYLDGPGYAAFWWNWAPRDKAEERAKKHQADYMGWAQQKLLTLTDGGETDYTILHRDILNLAKNYNISSMIVDRRFQGAQLCQQLRDNGIEVIEFGSSFGDFASPTKEFLTLVGRGEFRHGDNALVRWCSGNVMAKENSDGLIKPDKQKSGDKIDPIVAAIEAVAQASLRDTQGSVYETRGVLTV